MNNIEILEKHLEFIKNFDNNSSYIPALERIIAEYKELKIKLKEYEKQLDLDYVEKNYIPKAKISDLLLDYSVPKGRNERVINYKYFEPFLEELGKLLEE